MTDNNTCMMTWNSPMYSKSLQNKFLILVAVSVHLRFWPKRTWGQCWNGGVWQNPIDGTLISVSPSPYSYPIFSLILGEKKVFNRKRTSIWKMNPIFLYFDPPSRKIHPFCENGYAHGCTLCSGVGTVGSDLCRRYGITSLIIVVRKSRFAYGKGLFKHISSILEGWVEMYSLGLYCLVTVWHKPLPGQWSWRILTHTCVLYSLKLSKCHSCCITVTWASRCLKLPASRLWFQQLVLANNKEITETAHYWLCEGIPTVTKRPVMWKAFPCHGMMVVAVIVMGGDIAFLQWHIKFYDRWLGDKSIRIWRDDLCPRW